MPHRSPSLSARNSSFQRWRTRLRTAGILAVILAIVAGAGWLVMPDHLRTNISDWLAHHTGRLGHQAYYAATHRGWRTERLGSWTVLLPPAPAVMHDYRGQPQTDRPLDQQALWLVQAADAALAKLPAASGLGDLAVLAAGPLPRLILYPSERQLAATWSWPEGQATTGIYWGGAVGVVAPVAWLPVIHPAEIGLEALGEQGGLALESTLVHELTHWLHDTLSGGRMPRWLSEGLAVRAEERAYGSEAPVELTALRAVRAGAVPVSEFAAWFGSRDASRAQERSAYALARSLVCYLDYAAPLGWEQILVAGLGSGDHFEPALVKATGTELSTIEHQWLIWLDVPAKPQ